MVKIKECDMIVPTHLVDWNYFGANVKSWLKEVPIKTLYLGCNNPDEGYIKELKTYLSQYKCIEVIDQRGIKTLGMQLADLFKRCDTEFVCYCHADARPTPHSFLVLEADMESDVGITESERVQYKYENPLPYPTEYGHYYYIDRSFSGYQLFRMNAIRDFLQFVEDDYIYRNEDIIFQNVCENAGYRYQKSFSMHIHTCSRVNIIWTPQGEEIGAKEARAETFDMQIKGIVKYCTPDDLTKRAWRDAWGVCFKENGTGLFEFIETFVREVNPKWEKGIQESITELLKGII